MRWTRLCGLLAAAFFSFGVASRSQEVEKGGPITPTTGPILLFNGKDLGGFYTWLSDTKYEDPRKVFSVTDGMLHISGDGMGYVCTREAYRDYHLVIEFRWGDHTFGDRVKRARDSGVIVHCAGPDGSVGGIFLAGIEAQIIEGGVGDLLVVPGKAPDGSLVRCALTAETTLDRDGETVWKAGGMKKTFESGRINWYGRDPDWDDVLGFRGSADVESPGKQWTRMEVICRGDQITNLVNGVVVNKGFDARPSAGKILIQSELAEIDVRRFEIWPLNQPPKFDDSERGRGPSGADAPATP